MKTLWLRELTSFMFVDAVCAAPPQLPVKEMHVRGALSVQGNMSDFARPWLSRQCSTPRRAHRRPRPARRKKIALSPSHIFDDTVYE